MKTIKKVTIKFDYRDEIPLGRNMEENYIYIAKGHACFLCLCGCKSQTNLPITHGGWNLEHKGDKISITPSIWNHPCEAHYIITNNVANFV